MRTVLQCVALRRRAIVLKTTDGDQVLPFSIFFGVECFQVFIDGLFESALMGTESIGFGIQQT